MKLKIFVSNTLKTRRRVYILNQMTEKLMQLVITVVLRRTVLVFKVTQELRRPYDLIK